MDDENFEEIIALDRKNKYSDKIFKMTSFGSNKNITYVPDPYYRGDEGFEIVLDILEDSVNGLINKVEDDIRREN
jgi:protein-tyrosine phosphatase